MGVVTRQSQKEGIANHDQTNTQNVQEETFHSTQLMDTGYISTVSSSQQAFAAKLLFPCRKRHPNQLTSLFPHSKRTCGEDRTRLHLHVSETDTRLNKTGGTLSYTLGTRIQ